MIFALLLAAAVPEPVPAPELPVFTFRSITAGEVWPHTNYPFCHNTTAEEILCSRPETVAETPAFVSAFFYQDRLTTMIITGNANDWSAVRRAFEAKYGTPVSQHSEPWQSKGGLHDTDIVVIWKFKTGLLELHSVGGQIDRYRAMYFDTWHPPAAKPKVDF